MNLVSKLLVFLRNLQLKAISLTIVMFVELWRKMPLLFMFPKIFVWGKFHKGSWCKSRNLVAW